MVKASLNGLICQSGVTCKCAVAVNLLCGGCLWCRTDHVKYRLLFWIVLHGHESVKELILAGKEVSPVQQGTDGSHSEPRRVCEKGNCLSGPDVQQKQNVTVTVFQEINNTAVINTFLFLSHRGREELECFSIWCVNGWGGPLWWRIKGWSQHRWVVFTYGAMWWDLCRQRWNWC